MDLREKSRATRYRHPWEQARAAALLRFAADIPPDTQCADIGAGDLFFAAKLAAQSALRVLAVDPAYPGREERDGCRLLCSIAELVPASVDCMFVMDALEHVDDDAAFAASLFRVVRPGGHAVFTVPAHPWLFSVHDDFLGHRRRYTRRQFRDLLEAAGFRIDELFGFFTAPLVVRVCHKLLTHAGIPSAPARGVGLWPMPEHHVISRMLTSFLRFDFAANRALQRVLGVSAGLSICARCSRPA